MVTIKKKPNKQSKIKIIIKQTKNKIPPPQKKIYIITSREQDKRPLGQMHLLPYTHQKIKTKQI